MNSTNIGINDRKLLREQLRDRRRSIPAGLQDVAARAATEIILSQTLFPLGEHIALYMSADGELDTRYLLEALMDKGLKCYLPALIKPTTTLEFRQYQPRKPLVTNFYGLLEPDESSPVIAPDSLSMVFLPLVGFDKSGNRLGMGGGYYDRTFAFLKEKKPERPILVGLAHECQRVEKLEAAGWDVPLGGIITDRQMYLAS